MHKINYKAVGLDDQGPHIPCEGFGRTPILEVAINALSDQDLIRDDPDVRGSPRNNAYLGDPPSIMQLGTTYHPGTVSNRQVQIGGSPPLSRWTPVRG